jgi:hypothetical protein
MKKVIFLLLMFISVDVFAGFIIHSYYKEQISPDCHLVFVVITYDNNDGQGEIYQASGFVQVGNGCANKSVIQDEQCVLDLLQVMGTPEVNEQFEEFLNSKGIADDGISELSQISVFCNPNVGSIIVNRYANTVDLVEIRNLQGELKKSFSANLSKASERYDISDLTPGVYVVWVGKNSMIIHTDQIIR